MVMTSNLSAVADFFIRTSDGNLLGRVISVLLALILFGVVFMLRRKIVSLILRVAKKLAAKAPHADEVIDSFTKPLIALVVSLAAYGAVQTVFWGFETASPKFLQQLLRTAVIVTLTWGLLKASGPAVSAARGEKGVLSETLVVFLSRIIQVVILVLAAVMVMDVFEYDITGIITGLGIVGLAFSLAAQDTASNFIGGVVIVADKPFAVGDWIQTSSLEGVVEDISLRSTRIRTFKDALVVVSNSSLAADEIINWSRMNKRRVEMTLGFTYQTSRETLEKVVEGIRELLKSDENVVGDSTVAFNEFGESSLNVTVSYFLNQTGYADYIRLKEQLNFQIMDLCESLGADFAFPSRTVYLEGGKS